MREPAEGGSRRHRLQRLTALHRRCRKRREQHPPVDHRERLARSRRRAARPALLQHRHLHLLWIVTNRKAPTTGQGPADRRAPLLRQDAEEPRQQAQQDRRSGRRAKSTRSGTSRRSSATQHEETRKFTEEDPINSRPRVPVVTSCSRTPTSTPARSPSSPDRRTCDPERIASLETETTSWPRCQQKNERSARLDEIEARRGRQDQIRKLLADFAIARQEALQ